MTKTIDEMLGEIERGIKEIDSFTLKVAEDYESISTFLDKIEYEATPSRLIMIREMHNHIVKSNMKLETTLTELRERLNNE